MDKEEGKGKGPNHGIIIYRSLVLMVGRVGDKLSSVIPPFDNNMIIVKSLFISRAPVLSCIDLGVGYLIAYAILLPALTGTQVSHHQHPPW